MALGRVVIERIERARRLSALARGALGRRGAALCLSAALCVAAAAAPTTVALAQNSAAKPKPPAIAPLPPARPANIDAGSDDAGAPPPPAAAPANPQAPPAAAPDPNVASWKAGATGPLPAASRQRMHACGLEWQKMKMAGQALDKSWRDFAQICLTR
jgi:hypothetical protein